MKINSLNALVGGMNMMQKTDSVSKNIQNQIANAQKQLQEIASDKDMSIEEKMKKRQEIQQQIVELNNQLRQHQMEQRKAKQAKRTTMQDMLGGSRRTAQRTGKKGAGLSGASMSAIISADNAMAQAQIQGSVATRLEGKAGVLESEIKLDAARGGNVEAKKEELAEIQEKAAAAEAAQMNTLENANKELEAAAKEEQQTEKTTGKDKKADKNQDGTTKMVGPDATEAEDVTEVSEREPVSYTHVDVCL